MARYRDRESGHNFGNPNWASQQRERSGLENQVQYTPSASDLPESVQRKIHEAASASGYQRSVDPRLIPELTRRLQDVALRTQGGRFALTGAEITYKKPDGVEESQAVPIDDSVADFNYQAGRETGKPTTRKRAPLAAAAALAAMITAQSADAANLTGPVKVGANIRQVMNPDQAPLSQVYYKVFRADDYRSAQGFADGVDPITHLDPVAQGEVTDGIAQSGTALTPGEEYVLALYGPTIWGRRVPFTAPTTTETLDGELQDGQIHYVPKVKVMARGGADDLAFWELFGAAGGVRNKNNPVRFKDATASPLPGYINRIIIDRTPTSTGATWLEPDELADLIAFLEREPRNVFGPIEDLQVYAVEDPEQMPEQFTDRTGIGYSGDAGGEGATFYIEYKNGVSWGPATRETGRVSHDNAVVSFTVEMATSSLYALFQDYLQSLGIFGRDLDPADLQAAGRQSIFDDDVSLLEPTSFDHQLGHLMRLPPGQRVWVKTDDGQGYSNLNGHNNPHPVGRFWSRSGTLENVVIDETHLTPRTEYLAGNEVADPHVLKLLDGRFEVTADYQTQDISGRATAVDLNRENTGSLSFFDEANLELMVKILDACNSPDFNSYWVFAAGLTDLGVKLKVLDTHTGQEKTYTSALGEKFEAITDTDAFHTCDTP